MSVAWTKGPLCPWIIFVANTLLDTHWSCYGVFYGHVKVVVRMDLRLTADFWRRWAAAAAPRGIPLLKVRLSHMMRRCRRDSWENDRRRFAPFVE